MQELWVSLSHSHVVASGRQPSWDVVPMGLEWPVSLLQDNTWRMEALTQSIIKALLDHEE